MHNPIGCNYKIVNNGYLRFATVSLSGKISGFPNEKSGAGSVLVDGFAKPTSSLMRRIFVFLPSNTYSAFFYSKALFLDDSIILILFTKQ